MSRQRDVRLIIREIREMPEYSHLSYNDVLNIVYWSQFGFVKDVMSAGTVDDFDSYKSVLIRGLGSFVAHPVRVKKKIEYHNNKKNESING